MQSKAEVREATSGEKRFVEEVFVFVWIRILHVAADDVEEFFQLACVTVVHGAAIDDMGSRFVILRIIFKCKARREMRSVVFVAGRFDRAEFERAFRAADDETAMLHAVNFRNGNTNGCRGDGIFENSQTIVDETVVTRLPHERRDVDRFT